MCSLTSLIQPSEENNVKTDTYCTHETLEPPGLLHYSLPFLLPGLQREREERAIDQGDRCASAPPPASCHALFFISSLNPVAMVLKMAIQPLCLMIFWMIAFLSGIHAPFC